MYTPTQMTKRLPQWKNESSTSDQAQWTNDHYSKMLLGRSGLKGMW